MRSTLIVTLALAALPGCALASGLEALVAEALSSNASIAQHQAHQQAIDAGTEGSGAWPDPVLSIEYSNVPVSSLSPSVHPMSGIQLRAQQMLKPPAWSARQHTVAAARVQAASHGVAERETAVRASVESAWWELARARQLRAVTRSHVDRSAELLQAVRTRYETGRAGQHSVLRLEVLEARLRDSLDDHIRAERGWMAQLDGLLSRDRGTYDTPERSEAVAAPDDEAMLVELASRQRPSLARLDAEGRTSESAAVLARTEGVPDPTVWAGYRVRTVEADGGTDLVSVGVGIPLPTGSSRRARAAEASHLAAAQSARAARQADLDGVRAALRTLVASWQRAADKASIYETQLIPAASAARETAFTDYAVDEADFSSLFDAEVSLLELERGRISAVIDTQLALARARALTGDATFGVTP